jgi:hypothetical protein
MPVLGKAEGSPLTSGRAGPGDHAEERTCEERKGVGHAPARGECTRRLQKKSAGRGQQLRSVENTPATYSSGGGAVVGTSLVVHCNVTQSFNAATSRQTWMIDPRAC